MALTIEQSAYLRSELGDEPDDAALELIVQRYVVAGASAIDALGLAALEVLTTRLSQLENEPASFTVIGEYGQSTEQNMIALREHIRRLRGNLVDPNGVLTSSIRIIPRKLDNR